ncbi:MAG TPA: EamA family transporter [Gaiellaceae bacterium]|nr:EamA family transporter [Gaiellaceae bacterium]
MTPLLLALGASLAWGVADFAGPLFGRTLGTLPVLFWAEVGGVLGIGVAVAIRHGGPAGWGVLYATLAALGGMLGLWAYYHGMATGTMSVVAPIAGVSAVIPVIFGIATGDSPSPTQLGGIACALVGVGFASIEHSEGRRRVAAGVGLALLAAAGFGFYFPWMHAAGKVDFWWASFVFRFAALVIVAVIVAQQRTPIRLSRRNAAIAGVIGMGDTVGNVLFAAASGEGGLVSLTSVLASLYPVVTVLLAARVLHERVARLQRAGIVLTLVGVVLISV